LKPKILLATFRELHMDRRRAAPTIITINDIVVNQRPGMVNLDACAAGSATCSSPPTAPQLIISTAGRSDLPPILEIAKRRIMNVRRSKPCGVFTFEKVIVDFLPAAG